MFTEKFWVDAAERAIATFAQVVLSIVTVLFPATAIDNGYNLEVAMQVAMDSWYLVLLAGLGGAFYAVLKAIVAANKAGTDTASLVQK